MLNRAEEWWLAANSGYHWLIIMIMVIQLDDQKLANTRNDWSCQQVTTCAERFSRRLRSRRLSNFQALRTKRDGRLVMSDVSGMDWSLQGLASLGVTIRHAFSRDQNPRVKNTTKAKYPDTPSYENFMTRNNSNGDRAPGHDRNEHSHGGSLRPAAPAIYATLSFAIQASWSFGGALHDSVVGDKILMQDCCLSHHWASLVVISHHQWRLYKIVI